MTGLRSGVLVVVFAMSACGGQATPQAEPGDQTAGGESMASAPPPQEVDIDALLAAESGPFATHQVSAPDGSFNAQVEASSAPSASNEKGFVHIAAPFGEHKIEYIVYPEAKDGGEVVRLMVDATLVKGAPEHRWVDVHADQQSGWPYLIGRAHYVVDGPQGKLVGDFKIGISVRGRTTLVAIMDAPGQYASFERALRATLASADSASNRGLAVPAVEEIVRSGVPGMMATISRSERFRDGAKLITKEIEMDMTLGPDGALTTSDDASTEVYTQGRLDGGSYASGSMGEMDHVLELSYAKRRYRVKGTVQGKPVEGEFEVKGAIPDIQGANALACKVRDGKQPSARLINYVPAIDPLGATELTIEKASTQDADLRMILGSTQAAELFIKVDGECEAETGFMQMGPVKMLIERLWHQKHEG